MEVLLHFIQKITDQWSIFQQTMVDETGNTIAKTIQNRPKPSKAIQSKPQRFQIRDIIPIISASRCGCNGSLRAGRFLLGPWGEDQPPFRPLSHSNSCANSRARLVYNDLCICTLRMYIEYIHVFIYSFIYLWIYWLIYSSIYLFIHSFIYSFIYLYIDVHTRWQSRDWNMPHV